MAEYQMTLVNRREVASATMAFWLQTNVAKYEFRAGQHADFAFLDPSEGDESDNLRTFSLASSPHDQGLVMIAMRMRDTGFKRALKAVPQGTMFKVSRPRDRSHCTRTLQGLQYFLPAASELPYARHPSLGHEGTDVAPAIFVLFEPPRGRCSLS